MASKTKEGSWRVSVWYGTRRISKTFPTKALALDYEAKVRLARVTPGEQPRTRMTFGEFAEIWFRDYAAVEVAETTAAEYRSVYDNHFKGAFGDVPLAKLTKGHLRTLRAKLAGTHKPKTVNNIVNLAKGMMNTAVAWYEPGSPYVAVNPWDGVGNLTVDTQDFDYWDAAERDKFLGAVRFLDAPFAEVALVAVFTGLRLGELRALRRSQLDFDRGQICVEAVHSEKLGARYNRTKSRRVGYVPMDQQVGRVLYKRILYSPDMLVFEPEASSHACARLERLAKRVGVRPIRFHDLRHTFASNLMMAGADIYQVSKLLRHSTVKQTERYAHLAPEHLRSAISRQTSGTDLVPETGVATLR